MNGHHCPELPAPPPEGVAEAQALVFAYVPQWVSWATHNGHAVSQKGLTANTSPLHHTSTNTQTSTLHTHTECRFSINPLTDCFRHCQLLNDWGCVCVRVCARMCVFVCVSGAVSGAPRVFFRVCVQWYVANSGLSIIIHYPDKERD